MAATVNSIEELRDDPTFQRLPDTDKRAFARELFPDALGDVDDNTLSGQLGIKVPEIRAASGMEKFGASLQRFGPAGSLASTVFQAAMDPTSAAATVGDLVTRATPAGRIPFVPEAVGGVAATGMELARGHGVGQAVSRGAQEFAGGVVGEGIGRGFTRASLLFDESARPLSRKLSPDARAAIEFLEPRGVQVLPSEATDNVLLDLAHNLAEGGFVSAGRMQRFENRRGEALRRVSHELLDDIAPKMTPSQQAALLVTEVRDQNAMSKLFSNEMRAEFRARAGHLSADVANLRKIGQKIVDESSERSDIGSQLVALPTARQMTTLGRQTPGIPAQPEIRDKFTGEIIQAATPEVPPGPPLLSIEELDDLRQLLGDIKRQKELGQRPPQRVQKLMDRAIHEIDRLIDHNVRDPDALRLFRESNRLISERYATTDSDLLKRLVKLSDPGVVGKGGKSGFDPVVDVVFQNPDVVAATRRALGDSPEMRQLERRFIERQFANVTDSAGRIDGAALVKNLVGAANEHAERFGAQLARPGQRENILKFANALKTLQGQDRSKIGSVAVQLTQGGVLIGALTGRAPAHTAALAFVPPAVLAEMLLNRRSARLLLRTIEHKQSTKATTAALGRLAAETSRIASEQQAERAFGDRSKARTPSFRSQFERDRQDGAEAALVQIPR